MKARVDWRGVATILPNCIRLGFDRSPDAPKDRKQHQPLTAWR